MERTPGRTRIAVAVIPPASIESSRGRVVRPGRAPHAAAVAGEFG